MFRDRDPARHTSVRPWLAGLVLFTSTARADEWAARGSAAAALVISKDQVSRYGYDEISFVAALHVERALAGPLAARVGVALGAFPTSEHGPGGLAAVTLGPLIQHQTGRTRKYVAVEFGPALTGEIVRPYLSIEGGVDLALSKRFFVGPVVGYGQVFHSNRPGQSTDARLLRFGISCRLHLVRDLAAQPVVEPARRPEQEVAAAPEPPSAAELMALMEKALPPPAGRASCSRIVRLRLLSTRSSGGGDALRSPSGVERARWNSCRGARLRGRSGFGRAQRRAVASSSGKCARLVGRARFC
jgi:hypothetical protein